MKCFVCGSDSPGEVCNQCVRTERNLFHKEWDYKEGFIMKKVENYRVDVSTYRISGTGMISNSEKGLMARLDAFNHYVGNVISVEKKPYNGKDAVAIHYKNPETQMERFIFFVALNAEEGLRNAVDQAKKDLGESVGGASGGGGALSPNDAALKLKKLDVLLESGILSQEEYNNEKRKLGY